MHYFLYSTDGVLSICCTNIQDVEGDSLLSWLVPGCYTRDLGSNAAFSKDGDLRNWNFYSLCFVFYHGLFSLLAKVFSITLMMVEMCLMVVSPFSFCFFNSLEFTGFEGHFGDGWLVWVQKE